MLTDFGILRQFMFGVMFWNERQGINSLKTIQPTLDKYSQEIKRVYMMEKSFLDLNELVVGKISER